MTACKFENISTAPPPSSVHRYNPLWFLNILHAGGAINTDDLAIDPLAVLRGEEADDTGNVDREANTV